MHETRDHVVVTTTFAHEADAVRCAHILVEQRLVACAQLVPIRSVYSWKGVIEDEPEVRLECKTHRDRLDELARVVASLHPYETPELIAVPIVAGSSGYLGFLDEATRS